MAITPKDLYFRWLVQHMVWFFHHTLFMYLRSYSSFLTTLINKLGYDTKRMQHKLNNIIITQDIITKGTPLDILRPNILVWLKWKVNHRLFFKYVT